MNAIEEDTIVFHIVMLFNSKVINEKRRQVTFFPTSSCKSHMFKHLPFTPGTTRVAISNARHKNMEIINIMFNIYINSPHQI